MHRGPVVLIDEHNSSKLCPCCGKKLRNVAKAATTTRPKTGATNERLRTCPTADGETTCELFQAYPDRLDRDKLACFNLIRRMRAKLEGKRAPKELQRPPAKQSAKLSRKRAPKELRRPPAKQSAKQS